MIAQHDLRSVISAMAVAFRHLYGGEPDAVIFKTFYWDLRHIVSIYPHSAGDGDDPRITEWTSEYRSALEETIGHLRATFPTSVVALRTDPLWNVTFTSRFGSDPSYVYHVGMHLMSIVRMLSAQHDVALFDFFQIFEGLDPEEYLSDDLHVQPHYSRMMLKIILSGLGCS